MFGGRIQAKNRRNVKERMVQKKKEKERIREKFHLLNLNKFLKCIVYKN